MRVLVAWFVLLLLQQHQQPLLFSCGTSMEVHESSDSSGGFDFPSIVDPDDIAYFSSSYDVDGLHWALANVFALRRDRRSLIYQRFGDDDDDDRGVALPESIVSRGGGSTYTTAYKLQADLEQAEYLVNHVFSNPDQQDNESYDAQDIAVLRQYYQTKVIPTLQAVLNRIPPLEQLQRTQGLYAFRQPDLELGIRQVYNRALYVPEMHHDEQLEGPLLNPHLDVDLIQKQWQGMDEPHAKHTHTNHHPKMHRKGIVVIDDLLSPRVLEKVQKLLWENTVWYQTKMPQKFGGYTGAYIDDGLHQKILLQIAFALHRHFPLLFSAHDLRYLWAYKYDSDYQGINLHADQAAINVNLWLTPNTANMDNEQQQKSGGLVVYTAKPPPHWDFGRYNTDTEKVKMELLQPTGFENVTIPYKTNRAVVFDSALFHLTDRFKFKKGYRNRRINLTLLFGEMNLEEEGGDPTCGKEKAV